MDIEKSYILPFALTRVYDAWVSSSTVIPPATAMEIKPVVGGYYRLIMDTPEFSSRSEGTFSIVDPDQHVRYTWQWSGDDEMTEIDVKFTKVDSGTQVVISHSGFQSNESHANHDSGWDSYIEGFSAHLNANKDISA